MSYYLLTAKNHCEQLKETCGLENLQDKTETGASSVIFIYIRVHLFVYLLLLEGIRQLNWWTTNKYLLQRRLHNKLHIKGKK